MNTLKNICRSSQSSRQIRWQHSSHICAVEKSNSLLELHYIGNILDIEH